MSGITQAFAHIGQVIEQRNSATERVVRDVARRAERAMKSTHRWKNRTGAAERGLKATVTRRGGGRERHTEFDLVLTHGVEHGKYLEYRWAGRFAILRPTADRFFPELRREVRRAREAVR